jgi:hypothetical protein
MTQDETKLGRDRAVELFKNLREKELPYIDSLIAESPHLIQFGELEKERLIKLHRQTAVLLDEADEAMDAKDTPWFERVLAKIKDVRDASSKEMKENAELYALLELGWRSESGPKEPAQ